MYLFERLISLLIYVLCLFLICYAILHTKKKDNHRLLKIYTLMLAVMGYCFVPHTGADLSRLLITMHYYAEMTWTNLLDAISVSSTPGVGLYFFVIGKFGNDHLLPCISAFITFSLCFSSLKRQIDEKDVKSRYIATALLLFMSRGLMMQIISNIRTIMALAICAWCIYQEFYLHARWRKLIIPYIIAASLHVMGQAMLIYRLIFMIVEKANNPTQKIVRIITAVVGGGLIWIFGNSYITAFLTKAEDYYGYAKQGTGFSYVWEGILCIFTLSVVLYMIVTYRRIKPIVAQENSDEGINETAHLVSYMIPLAVIDIFAGFIEFNFFLRINWYLTILMIPLCVQLLKVADFTGKEKVLRHNIVITAFVILLLACARGDLCSLKFFLF